MMDAIFQKKAFYFEKSLKAFDLYRAGAKALKLPLLIWLGDFSVFTLIGLYDLWILQCDYQKAISSFQRNFYARQTALITFELLEDISQFGGKNYQLLLLEIIDDPTLKIRATSARKRLNQTRNDHSSRLKTIRDSTIAHRDQDINQLINLINSLDDGPMLKFALDFMTQVEDLQSVLNDAIGYINRDRDRLEKPAFLEKYSA